MSESPARMARAAKQLMDTELLLGADFQPIGRCRPPEMSTVPSAPAAAGAPIGAGMTPEQKDQTLKQLEAEHVSNCRLCALNQTRTHTVFGEGSPTAELVFVGEAPGGDEDRLGRPFVGRAGQLLDKMIAAMGLRRQDVYICNVLKCRPPGNRAPAPEEVVACSPYLLGQLEILAPRVIVTLGNPATQTLLRTRTGITQLRGQWQLLPALTPGLAGTPVMPTFHPAYVLRNYDQATRAQVWSDLKKVVERLGLKIPAKK